MSRFIFFLASLAFIFILSNPVSAVSNKTFSLPSSAKQISPNLYDLGQKVINGRVAQGYAFVHRNSQDKQNQAKNGSGKSGATSCYGFLAKDARWKVTEPYLLDATNNSGLLADYIATASAVSMSTWDNEVAFNIFGSRVDGIIDGADASSPDGKNEIYFGSIAEPGVIAVTTIWGYFSGPIFARELIEYDMVLDDVDFNWGDALTDSSVMDFQNIATHELGHALGLADLYNTSCNGETMYGYASEGEINKRDLNPGDITGIKKLYP